MITAHVLEVELSNVSSPLLTFRTMGGPQLLSRLRGWPISLYKLLHYDRSSEKKGKYVRACRLHPIMFLSTCMKEIEAFSREEQFDTELRG